MNDGLRNLLIGTPLGVAVLIAICLTLVRGRVKTSEAQLQAAVRVVVVAILLQAAHFAEEAAAGLHQRLPELLGLNPWPFPFFVGFNLLWLGIWGLSAWGLAVRQPAALFPLWFLGVACVVNALVHPSLSLRTGGYFPGLFTFPLVTVVGVLLLRRLFLITSDGSPVRRTWE
jgi:hypothetical protein